MEKHLSGRDGESLLCPFCHLTQHLEEASRLGAGKIVWLPEVPQAHLVSYQATLFMMMVAPQSHHEVLTPILKNFLPIESRGTGALKNLKLDELIEARSQDRLHNFFLEALKREAGPDGGSKNDTFAYFSPSDPFVLANLIKKNPEKQFNLDGLRMLFSPKPFKNHLLAWREEFYAERPPAFWMSPQAAEQSEGMVQDNSTAQRQEDDGADEQNIATS